MHSVRHSQTPGLTAGSTQLQSPSSSFVRAESVNRADIEPTKTIALDWRKERLGDVLRFTWVMPCVLFIRGLLAVVH
jgi:hypothetical protein